MQCEDEKPFGIAQVQTSGQKFEGVFFHPPPSSP